METMFASPEQLAWEKTCPHAITSDVIWKLDGYRASLFLLHLSRSDCQAVRQAQPHSLIAGQLIKAAGSVSANLGEGYSRATRTDRLRFLDYALGSTRECVSWYQAARGALPDETVEERLVLLTRIRALLLGLIRSIRDRAGSKNRFEV